MLDQSTRTAILLLREKGFAKRKIARLVKCSRGAVNDVIRTNRKKPPVIQRVEKAEQYRDEIIRLYPECKGNLVRVHEILAQTGASLSYQALTAFCRRHNIVKPPKLPAGHFDFSPGKEMQHDTSPHRLWVSDRQVLWQTAGLVLNYSRSRYMQIYPRFNRFVCKVFLQEAAEYFGGVAENCMVDNTSVVRAYGTGANMVPAPEMEAFGERLGFKFVAHEVGDANRSAYVERFFDNVENNFLAGRKFADFVDVNRQARLWCDKYNNTFKRYLHATPFELLAAERPHLKPLPEYLPEIYQIHTRVVNAEGCVSVHRHQYSVPYELIDRQLQVRETMDSIFIYHGPRQVAEHLKTYAQKPQRVISKAHRPARGTKKRARSMADEILQRIMTVLPETGQYANEVKRRARGRGILEMKRLWRLIREYPSAPLLSAVQTAWSYGLYDLDRLERMILRNIAGNFFNTTMEKNNET